jgi:hypothetical protein
MDDHHRQRPDQGRSQEALYDIPEQHWLYKYVQACGKPATLATKPSSLVFQDCVQYTSALSAVAQGAAEWSEYKASVKQGKWLTSLCLVCGSFSCKSVLQVLKFAAEFTNCRGTRLTVYGSQSGCLQVVMERYCKAGR